MDSPVLLFDGVCNLCNGLVKFIIRHEKNSIIKFSPLQSPAAKVMLEKNGLNSDDVDLDSVVFIDNGKAYQKSEAVFRIAGYLKKPFSNFTIFRYLPSSFNNFVYRLVSGNRYSIFGRRKSCMVPNNNLKHRFIE